MWTRSSDRWKEKPGNFDTVNARRIFPSSSVYGIPDIPAPTVEQLPAPPECLIPYNIRVRSKTGYTDAAMHFFLDDYRFELCWSKPVLTLSRVKQAWCALTPDFSLYADYPVAAQIWNTYRNRWLGAYWREEGLLIIPTIAWSTRESFEFCFDGVEKHSPVAVSYQGIRKSQPQAVEMFEEGYREMMSRINPRFVICYGKLPQSLQDAFPDNTVRCYPTYWEGLRAARKSDGASQDTKVHPEDKTPGDMSDLSSISEMVDEWSDELYGQVTLET